MIKVSLTVVGCLAATLLIAAAAVFIIASRSFRNLHRVDENGTLYYAEYIGNYSRILALFPFSLFRGGGCSAFIARNENGDVITARNYDLQHKDDKGNVTGLNVVVKCSPKKGYRSVNVADAAFISYLKLPYYTGSLDGNITRLPLVLLPYLCMDGINEKGLCLSILALDTRPGEKPMHQKERGRKKIMVNQLLRFILDTCEDIRQAIELTEKFNIVNTFNFDYHIFLTDVSGNSAVFEWRHNTFTVTYTDAATNFYVGYDDACDCYYGDKLKEYFDTPVKFKRDYHYGYGHGYARFATLAEAIDRKNTPEMLTAVISENEAFSVLAQVAQEYIPDTLTSHTQYSAVYNNSKKTLEICPMRNFKNHYFFSFD